MTQALQHLREACLPVPNKRKDAVLQQLREYAEQLDRLCPANLTECVGLGNPTRGSLRLRDSPVEPEPDAAANLDSEESSSEEEEQDRRGRGREEQEKQTQARMSRRWADNDDWWWKEKSSQQIVNNEDSRPTLCSFHYTEWPGKVVVNNTAGSVAEVLRVHTENMRMIAVQVGPEL